MHREVDRAAQEIQVWSNSLYIVTGVVGIGLASGMPIALGRSGQTAVRVAALLVSTMIVVTGMVSTWYHRTGADACCAHGDFMRLQRVDVGCANATAVAGVCLVLPLTILGLVRRPAAGPIVMLVASAVLGAAAIALYVNLSSQDARTTLRPYEYDFQHGTWHVLSALSALMGLVAVFLALRPAGASG